MPIPGAQDETNPLHLDSMIWEWQMGFKQKKMWSGWITGQPKQLFNLCFYSLDLPEILPKGKTEVFFFFFTSPSPLPPNHLQGPPAWSRTSFTMLSWHIHISWQTLHWFSCLPQSSDVSEVFLKVGCHLPWVLLWACPISPRFITLETLLAVSIFVNTVWYSVCVCVCSSSKEDLLKSSDFLPMCCVKY